MTTADAGAPSWRWVLVLCGAGALYWLVLLTMMVTGNPNLFPTLLLLGALVAPATLVVYANWWHQRALVDGRLVIWVALLSGVVGVLLASILEYATTHQRGTWPLLTGAVVEETLKALVPIGVLALGAAPDRRAGVVVGIASGAGFAVLETMGYGFSALLRPDALGAGDPMLLLRGVFAPAAHLAWTGVLTAALWNAGARRSLPSALRLAGTYVVVVLLHMAWDSGGSWFLRVALALVSLALLLVVVHRTRRPVPVPA